MKGRTIYPHEIAAIEKQQQQRIARKKANRIAAITPQQKREDLETKIAIYSIIIIAIISIIFL